MAVGLGPLPDFHAITGLRLGVARAGIKKPGRRDLVVMALEEGAQVAGIFTRNQFCAAPVLVTREHLSQAAPRFLLINTGNANAGNGEQGVADARTCCAALADLTGTAPNQTLPFSTGVIGEPLPVEVIRNGLPEALDNLAENHWAEAAEGIMTTDTLPKGATCRLELDGKPVHISGISKGAGMIRPNMATMLGFLATDADIEPALLQSLVSELGEQSFNRITIDGDTSTNDACMLVATGRSEAARLTADSPHLNAFREALKAVFMTLAHAIVRDGEGATKFITIRVEQAASTQEALDVAYTLAHSPLVKTALFASDPNWGRILAAVGRAGVPDLDLSAIEIDLGDVALVRNGGRAADYTEARGQAVMDESDITIRVGLGRGEVNDTVWTCDLSQDYVTINAEYRT
ncbi:bifunctional glutamate N-acetyltransferase/amino-acid acetyltransferase ArgJ [Marinobacter sp. JSM 1782161]|uniref:bifunctional glutamate N-acetyltransferase/amino-acid acetyltransferase ArgJ n=1 Tax=Marinobacter sp. JSM 1782161 TaxID=2685906 RepID=UPI001402F546|nr:bifunctional glutamate N-acetyltransferase/amino-acid acetyltransferase ArgJ [Marinobacter sp. JSM 1782161]